MATETDVEKLTGWILGCCCVTGVPWPQAEPDLLLAGAASPSGLLQLPMCSCGSGGKIGIIACVHTKAFFVSLYHKSLHGGKVFVTALARVQQIQRDGAHLDLDGCVIQQHPLEVRILLGGRRCVCAHVGQWNILQWAPLRRQLPRRITWGHCELPLAAAKVPAKKQKPKMPI